MSLVDYKYVSSLCMPISGGSFKNFVSWLKNSSGEAATDLAMRYLGFQGLFKDQPCSPPDVAVGGWNNGKSRDIIVPQYFIKRHPFF